MSNYLEIEKNYDLIEKLSIKTRTTSKNVSDEFIEDQKRKYQNGETTALIPVYQTLERQGKFKDISNEEKWWTVEKAMSNLLEEEKELNDIFKFRNLKAEI